MLMVPKSASAHSIKSRVVPKSAIARERVNTADVRCMHTGIKEEAKPSSKMLDLSYS